MLILTRRVGESIKVGQDITVTVLGVRGTQVRVGISAPKEFPFTAKKSLNASSKNTQTKFPKVGCQGQYAYFFWALATGSLAACDLRAGSSAP